jgi:hypothetical protein
MRSSLFVLPVVLGLLGVGTSACSSDDDTAGTSSTSGAATSCAADKRKDIYAQGMMKPASDLEIAIVDSAFTPSKDPAKPGQVQKGMNTITVEVLDAAKAPVDGAAVNLNLWMPDHSHGSAAVPVITPKGGGKYQITNVWLPMAGLWRFTVEVKGADGVAKSTDFNFCVDG